MDLFIFILLILKVHFLFWTFFFGLPNNEYGKK